MMKLEHPQEIEVWYVIPAVKRELAKSMINDYELSQKKVAEVLGLTESAVSQYINLKRAHELEFNDEFKALIKESAKEVMEGKHGMVRAIQMICDKYRRTKGICDAHKKFGVVYQENCKACEGYYD